MRLLSRPDPEQEDARPPRDGRPTSSVLILSVQVSRPSAALPYTRDPAADSSMGQLEYFRRRCSHMWNLSTRSPNKRQVGAVLTCIPPSISRAVMRISLQVDGSIDRTLSQQAHALQHRGVSMKPHEKLHSTVLDGYHGNSRNTCERRWRRSAFGVTLANSGPPTV